MQTPSVFRNWNLSKRSGTTSKGEPMSAQEFESRINSIIKLLLVGALALSFVGVVGVVLYGVMFVTQPMSGQSPNDKALFAILTPLAIFLPTVINHLLGNMEKAEAVQSVQSQPQPQPQPERTPDVTGTTESLPSSN